MSHESIKMSLNECSLSGDRIVTSKPSRPLANERCEDEQLWIEFVTKIVKQAGYLEQKRL
jgi:hypothetical protein